MTQPFKLIASSSDTSFPKMGKYDHIPELTSADNYIPWEMQVQLVLTNDDLWCHITEMVDPNDILGTASTLPIAVTPASPTAAAMIS
jgi:hypothetical protein